MIDGLFSKACYYYVMYMYVLLAPLIDAHSGIIFSFNLYITLADVSGKLLNAHLYLYVSQHLSGAPSQTGCPEAGRGSECQYEQL